MDESLSENLPNLGIDMECLESFDLNVDLLNDSEDLEKYMTDFERSHRPSNSVIQEKYHIARLKEFAKSKGYDDNFEYLETGEMDTLLREFYCDLIQKSGQVYSPASLLCIRAAIHRYLSNSPWNKQFSIIEDRAFLSSNNMLKAKVAESLKSGKSVNHFEMIQEGDQQKMETYFDRSDPVKLQEEVWYNIVYHFGLRGRESLKELKDTDFKFEFDSENYEYYDLKRELPQKNVKAGFRESDFDNRKCARMYATNKKNCPVSCLKLYLAKIHGKETETFWPKAKKNVKIANSQWYEKKQVVGRTVLGEMMKRISINSKLSRIYTNHCVRPTLVSNLKTQNFRNDEIALITGHKSEKSVQRYDRLVQDRTLKRMSNVLSGGSTNNSHSMKICSSSNEESKSIVYNNCEISNYYYK